MDTKNNLTGENSYATNFLGITIIFHVSTMLPSSQLEKKKFIGNDVTSFVFTESELPLAPLPIKSQFTHNFIFVKPISSPTDTTHYKVEVASKNTVDHFPPELPEKGIFKNNASLRPWLLTKSTVSFVCLLVLIYEVVFSYLIVFYLKC